jgi:glycerophosphoryl diester phosphodiesterase
VIGHRTGGDPDNLVFLIEVKSRADATKLTLSSAEKRKLWAAITRYDVADRVIIASFPIDAIKSLKASRSPGGVRYALNDRGALVNPNTAAKSVAGFYVVKWDLVTRSQVAAYRDAGLYVCLYTPNSSADLNAAIRRYAKRHHHR